MTAASFAPIARLYQSGHSTLAEAQCRALLTTQPQHAEANHLLGVILLQTGRAAEALPRLEAAVKARSGNLEAQMMLGTALAMNGETERAQHCFEKVVRAQPGNLQAFYNLGLSHAQQGRHVDARKTFSRILAKDARNVSALFGFGAALAGLCDFAGAAKAFAQANALAPGQPEILERLTMAYLDANRFDSAIETMNTIPAALKNTRPLLLILQARIVYRDGNYSQTLNFMLRAMETVPQLSRMHCLILKDALFRSELWELSEEKLRIVHTQRPEFPAVNFFLGYALYLLERHQEALVFLTSARESNFDAELSNCILSTVYSELGDFEQAIDCSRRAIDANPREGGLTWDLSLKLLTAGRLQEGWDLFALRFSFSSFEQDRLVPPDRIFRGLREQLADKTVLVWKEQGIGDELAFLSALPDLTAVAQKTILLCSTKLAPLLARSFPAAEVVPFSDPSAQQCLARAEVCLPVGDLFVHFRRRIADFPSRRSYLLADQIRAAAWREWLDGLGEKRKIGISWTSTWFNRQRLKTIFADLSEWGPILNNADFTFINLQPKFDSRHVAAAERDFGCAIHTPPELDQFDDIDGVAALVSCLDGVISVGSFVAYLAGALGVPTRMFLFENYHWDRLGTDRLPWLPSLGLLERQVGGTWGGAVDKAAYWLSSGLDPHC